MNKLEQAARALLAHWDTPAWKYLKPTGDLMADLREALAEQTEQEPVATVVDESEEQTNTMSWILSLPLPVGTKLYAAPVRTKDLTDDEIEEIGKSYFDEWSFGFARAVIAADREKNK